MKAYRVGILFTTIAAMLSTVVCKPEWLASNKFLEGFITYEIIAVLIVILTITFASVANIHLTLNRIELNINSNRSSRLREIRDDINGDAWVLFWAFLVCVASLLLKGAFPDDIYVKAVTNGVGITILLLNALVLHTIYRSVFMLVTVENLLGQANRDQPAARQDFTDGSPPTGAP